MASTSVVPKTRSSVNSGGLPRARRDCSKRTAFVWHAAADATSFSSPGIAASLERARSARRAPRRGRGFHARDEVSLLSRSSGGRENKCGAAARVDGHGAVVALGSLGEERGVAEVAEPGAAARRSRAAGCRARHLTRRRGHPLESRGTTL